LAEPLNFASDAIFTRIGAPRKERAEQARRQLGMASLGEFVRRALDEACDRAGVPWGDSAAQRSGPTLPAA